MKYKDDKALKIDINIVEKNDEVIVEIKDNGKGIDNIELARQPLYTSKPELERSGMGFTVMETFMDEVEVISEIGHGVTVTMFKRLQADK